MISIRLHLITIAQWPMPCCHRDDLPVSFEYGSAHKKCNYIADDGKRTSHP